MYQKNFFQIFKQSQIFVSEWENEQIPNPAWPLSSATIEAS